MMDLFTSFNPTTSTHTSMNWMMMVLVLIMPFNYWMSTSPPNMLKMTMMYKMKVQFKSMIKTPSMMPMMTMTIMFILYMNIYGLIPYYFSTTSQIAINLPMALNMWMSTYMIKMNNLNLFMSHLTPSNTPLLLIPFMNIIEMISLLIQPTTLAVRLTANVTAGHIMLTLITHLYNKTNLSGMIMIPHSLLMIMEIMMAMIQAYVFSMLIIMYNK